MNKEYYSKIFLILCSINITCLLISNIITIKTISIFSIVITAADILFPITYILNDIFTEVYGFKKSKLVIWLSFCCNLIMVLIFQITIFLPGSSDFTKQNELKDILGTTPRILLASFIAFIIGNFANSIVLSKLKVKTKGKYLALRTITSTLIGEGLDTIIFVPLVFTGTLSFTSLISLIINIYILKVLLEIILTPVTYKIIALIKNKENTDIYDNDIKYKLI